MSQIVKKIAAQLKEKRESLGMTKIKFAQTHSAGRNFLSDCENGKETAQIGKVLQYADDLNFKVVLLDKEKPLNALKEAIAIASKVDKSLANRLIMILTEEEKMQIDLHEVKIRQQSNIKKITLTV